MQPAYNLAKYDQHTPQNTLQEGAMYFIEGAKLMWHPSLRLYCLVPLLANLLLFFVITAAFVAKYKVLIDGVLRFLPDLLAPVAWIFFIVFGVLLLIVYGYSFNLITNIIAAPFYGRLAEKTESLLTGKEVPPEPLLSMIPRVIWRECVKLFYFFTRGIIIILIILFVSTLPLIQLLAPFIGSLWGAWSMSIQYADYPADNNQLDFKPLRRKL